MLGRVVGGMSIACNTHAHAQGREVRKEGEDGRALSDERTSGSPIAEGGTCYSEKCYVGCQEKLHYWYFYLGEVV
jgi:hypothetical protein